jgi:hypothetical protein
MTLVWIVYLVNLLTSVDNFLGGFIGCLITLAVVGGFAFGLALSPVTSNEWKEYRTLLYRYFLWPKTLVLSILICWLIPSEKVIQYLAGAYIIEETYKSEFVQKASTLAGQAVLNQLAVWAKDNGEVEKLLTQLKEQGVSVPQVAVPALAVPSVNTKEADTNKSEK